MLKKVALGVAMTLAAGSALAANCPSTGTPFPGGIAGFLTCDTAASKCEQKAAGNVASKLVSGIVKCQAKLAAAVNKLGAADPNDEVSQATCRVDAVNKYLVKTVVTDCPCINPVGIGALASSVLGGSAYYTYCQGWDTNTGTCDEVTNTAVNPTTGDVTGCVSKTKSDPTYKCAAGYGKCIPKLVKDWLKCNSTAAKDFIKDKPIDPILCQNGPIPNKAGKAAVERYNACNAKVEAKGGCDPCNAAYVPAILTLTGAQLNGANNLNFCTSTSGAFLD